MPTKLETFTSPRFTGKIVLADVEFLDSLQKIDQFAQAIGVVTSILVKMVRTSRQQRLDVIER